MGMVLGIVREEMPQFTLVHKAATYEVRRYGPSVIAECSYGGHWGDSNDGRPFGALARYIGVFGDPQNKKQDSIAMTAPVLVTPTREPIAMTAPVLVTAQAQADTMAFVLPASRYNTVAEAPAPTDPRVRLRQLPERLQAVRTFTWSFSAAAARKHLEMLCSDLASDGWTPRRRTDGDFEWQAAGYNPPFTLPFMRRNEVLVTVEEKNV